MTGFKFDAIFIGSWFHHFSCFCIFTNFAGICSPYRGKETCINQQIPPSLAGFPFPLLHRGTAGGNWRRCICVFE